MHSVAVYTISTLILSGKERSRRASVDVVVDESAGLELNLLTRRLGNLVCRYLSELLAERQNLGPFMQVFPNCSRLLNQGKFEVLVFMTFWFLNHLCYSRRD
jgi:hypothetical protein